MSLGEHTAAERPVALGADVTVQAGARPRLPRVEELAWMAVIPCAVVVVLAIVILGPELGRVLFPASHTVFWPAIAEAYEPPLPEPTEHARFLVSLTAPLLLTGLIVLASRRARPLPSATIGGLATGAQGVALAFVVICVVVQRTYSFELEEQMSHVVYFTAATLAVAGAIALAACAALASERGRRALGRLLRETRARRVAGSGLAVAVIAVWLMPAINTEGTIGGAHDIIVGHIAFWLDEAFALLDGRYPLVNFAAQYGSLWLYPVAGAMALLGSSIGVFTVAMSLISGASMLALYATMRRVVRSTAAAVLVFLPLLATSFFMMRGPLADRYAIDNLFSTFPLRYSGPLLLLWLVARQLDGATPRRRSWLFLAAGVVMLNNADFGVPALGATAAALLWAQGAPTARQLRSLAIEAAIGLAAALALVSVLTLATAGSLPHLGLLVRYGRLFALAGFGMLPMRPVLGMSTIIYLTYVAAIGVATVRAVQGTPDRLMTGLLAWSGIFGLGVGSYYMGRSHPEVLTNMFAAWALSMTLLSVIAVRTIAARPSHRPTLAEAACLFGFGVMACSLAQTPTPWSQVSRLRDASTPIYAHPTGEPFVALHTRPGEAVAILPLLGHKTAYDLGIVDVTKYTGTQSMPTIDQFDETLRDLRAAGGRKVFISTREEWPGVAQGLLDRGYRITAREKYGMLEYVRPG